MAKAEANEALMSSEKIFKCAEAMKAKAAADHAHNLVDEEKARILLQVTDANCKSRPPRENHHGDHYISASARKGHPNRCLRSYHCTNQVLTLTRFSPSTVGAFLAEVKCDSIEALINRYQQYCTYANKDGYVEETLCAQARNASASKTLITPTPNTTHTNPQVGGGF